MSRLTDRLERDLRELAAGVDPSPSAWESIVARLGEAETEVDHVVLGRSARSSRRAWITAAAAAFVLIVGAIAALTRAGDDPSTSPAELDLTATFVSPRNGFSVDHPDGATVTPATARWDPTDERADGIDIVATEAGAVFEGASLPYPGPPSGLDAYIDELVSRGGCGEPRREQAAITIDGWPGTISECPGQVVATVDVNGRIYRFRLLHDGRDARARFDAFADTIRLTPETAIDFPDLATQSTFVSQVNRFSAKYVDRGEGTLEPATEPWDPGNEQDDDGVDVIDTFEDATFTGASAAVPDGVDVDDWVDQTVSPDGCDEPRSQQAEITVDGQPGRLTECPELFVATVVAGDRLYRFTLFHDRSDARAYFDAFLATVDLTPDTTVEVPDLSSTFVSPTNGFAMGYLDRGGLEPAAARWDPAVQVDEMRHPPDHGFDVVETGVAAYFLAASTVIPDGVSIDDWVDTLDIKLSSDSGLPRSAWERCFVPRHQQEEVTIDEQPGRVLECPSEILATVVAGGRLYLFTLLHSRGSDARAVFDAWVATIDLRPEAAAEP